MSTDPYKKLIELFDERLNTYKNIWALLEKAGPNDVDVAKARELISGLREPGKAIEKLVSDIESHPISDIQDLYKVRVLSGLIFQLDAKISKWVGENLATEDADERLTETYEGCKTIVRERILPKDWDYDKNIVCLAGKMPPNIIKVLEEVGQKRVVLFDPSDAEYPDWVVRVKDPKGAEQIPHKFSDPNPERLASFTITTGMDMQKCEEFFGICHHHIQHTISTIRTIDNLGPVWIPQGVDNLRYMAECAPISNLMGRLSNLPMLILAPGPSLESNVESIRKAKGKFLTVAFSQTLKSLQAHDIHPDLVFIVDPSDLSYHFEGCDLDKVSGLVLGITCHPNMYRLPIKHKFYYSGNVGLEGWLTACLGPHLLQAAGTVAHTAFSFGCYLNANPILIAGMDLAFDGDRVYASNGCDTKARAVYGDDSLMKLEGHQFTNDPVHYFEVPGYYGGLVRTSSIYNQFRRWFELKFAEVAKRGTRVVNCTEGGAFIKNAEHMTLEQALEYFPHAEVEIGFEIQAASIANVSAKKRKIADHVAFLLDSMDKCAAFAPKIIEASELPLEEFKPIEKEFKRLLGPVGFATLVQHKEVRAIKSDGDDSRAGAKEMAERFLTIAEDLRPRLAAVQAELSDDVFLNSVKSLQLQQG